MICVGAEWSFGRGGEGNVSMLEELGEKSGFSVTRIDPVEADGQVIAVPGSGMRLLRVILNRPPCVWGDLGV